jgi:hypothetical protein
MFAGKAAPSHHTRVGSWLNHNNLRRLERLDRGKHSSLIRKSINYSRKMLYDIGPWREREFFLSFCIFTAAEKKFFGGGPLAETEFKFQ